MQFVSPWRGNRDRELGVKCCLPNVNWREIAKSLIEKSISTDIVGLYLPTSWPASVFGVNDLLAWTVPPLGVSAFDVESISMVHMAVTGIFGSSAPQKIE